MERITGSTAIISDFAVWQNREIFHAFDSWLPEFVFDVWVYCTYIYAKQTMTTADDDDDKDDDDDDNTYNTVLLFLQV